MKINKNWTICMCLFLVIILGGILRFYKLGSIPPGLTDDEVNAGYDAYSLHLTGKDQWGISYPLFSFKGFGDYRSPVYTYLLLPLLPVFGMTPFWLRFPAAALGTLTIILVYLIARKLGFSRLTSYIAAFFLAINPWHVGMSREAMVIISGLFFLCSGMAFYLYAKKRMLFIITGALFFALTIYAYPAYVVVTPLCITFISVLLLRDKHLTLPQFGIGMVILVSLIIPYMIASQSSSLGVRMRQVNIFRDSGTIDLLNEKLGACQKIYPPLICKATYNRFSAYSTKFIVNYIRHFSPDLLFSNGTSTQYSILPVRGLLLSIEYVFFVIGLFYLLLHHKKVVPAFILCILIFSPIPDSFTGDGHYGRYFVVLPFIQLAGAYGFGEIMKSIGVWIIVPVIGGLLLESTLFGVEYLTYYPYAFSRFSHYGYEELSHYLVKAKNEYDDIYVSSGVNDAKQYIFYLFYTKFDPTQFQTSREVEKIVEPNGWVRVKKIGNIHFIPSLPDTETILSTNDAKILYIGAPPEFPKIYLPSQYEIYDKRGDVLFLAVTYADWKRCLIFSCNEKK